MSFKVGFIGTGGRSVEYAQEYARLDDVEVVALADPVPAKRSAMIAKAQLTGAPAEYHDWRDLARSHPDLDGVVICSPNHLHAEHAVPFLERGLPVALEKPLAATQEDCERILDAERLHGGRTLLGFVLRSAPFYKKISDIVRSGAIGAICSIEAHEQVRWIVTSLLMRGIWRRYQRTSGGSILEKCCHDLDIINWLMDARPISLNSYGGRLTFTPNPTLPERCSDCKVAADCNYHYTPKNVAREEEVDQTLHQFMDDKGVCIYNVDKDVTDMQSINIEYETGAVVNFLYNLNVGGSRGSRAISIYGQKGSIWGDIDEMQVTLYENRTDKETVFPITTDGSGHGGGDRDHALELVRMMREPAYRPDQNALAGYTSAIMCLASDISRLERRRVNFRYRADGKMDII